MFTAEETRRFLAEEIRVSANIQSPHVIDAIASTPRDRFLPPGPWLIRGGADLAGSRQTDDADPRHVHHDVAVAVDPDRHLYNGQPSLMARWMQDLGVSPGQHVVHVGCGTGYFTALIGHVVGAAGRVTAIDIDPSLVERARMNLADKPWVLVAEGNGARDLPAGVDAVIVNAGATHVLDAWLDAVRDGGAVLVPLTVGFPGMPESIAKGVVVTLRRSGDDWRVKPSGGAVAIYSLKEVRDDAVAGAALGRALMTGTLMKATRLRRDPHEPGQTCVVHGDTTCLST